MQIGKVMAVKGSLQDLSNKKYGKLTILEFIKYTGDKSPRKAIWKVKCDCGKIFDINVANLKTGHTRSCGCLIREKASNKYINKKFNNLTAIKLIEIKKGQSHWLFRCDCGSEVIKRISSVKNGDTKSCGCVTKLNKINSNKLVSDKKIGKLTPIEQIGIYRGKAKKSVRSIWRFKCDCGNDYENVLSFVKRQKIGSCGCTNVPTIDSSLHIKYLQYKYGAYTRDYKFELTFDEFKNIINRDCYYCKSEPQITNTKTLVLQVKMNGVDRVDNRRGYHLDNVVPCCSICNKMKLDLGYDEFMAQIQRIANRSCGDDYNTRTTYVSEANVGDTTKILLLCVYDMVEKFNMQKSEVKALFNNVVDEHITEVDELTGEVS
jgi:hypothetical protein